MALLLKDNDSRLNAADVLNLVAIFLVGALTALFRRALGEAAAALFGICLGLLALTLLLAFLSSRRPIFRVLHDFSPALTVLVLFNVLQPLIDCVNPQRWDTTFRTLDVRLFGSLDAAWQGVLGRPLWFTDLMSLAYVSYYLAPVVLAIILYHRERLNDFRCLVFTVVLTFYASYVGYFLFPTEGPRLAPGAQSVLVGGAVSHALRAFIDVAERTRTDAFPSGHTALALVCLYFAWHTSRTVFGFFVPVVAGIVFSTVYLHYHYVVDVLAGVALAGGTIWVGPRLEPVCEPRAMVQRLSVHLGLR